MSTDLPATPLSDDPDLDQLRTRARELQRAVRRGDEAALAEVAVRHPDGAPADDARAGWRLSEAQLTVARRHGFASWPALVRYLEVNALHRRAPDEVEACSRPADEFLRLACLTYAEDGPARWQAAAELLASRRDEVSDDVWVASACADVPTLGRLLARDPHLAGVEGGPYRWAPLAYLAYARHDPYLTREAVVDAARLLLEHGADPDTGYLWHGMPSPFTALTGALGEGEGGPRLQPRHPQALALARTLLEAGADPNDAQTLYNRMFEPDDDHLELLFEFGLGTGDGGVWRRRLTPCAMSPDEMLARQLSWAAQHGFRNRIALLAEQGVDLDRELPAYGTSGRSTAYQRALTSGQPETAELLARLGATAPPLDPVDQLIAGVLTADRARVEAIRATHPGALARARRQRRGLVVWAAAQGRVDAVRLAAELGWDVSARARADIPGDQEWETGLHQAAMNGDLPMARALLELGADPAVRDARFDATPQGWAEHFEQPELSTLLAGITPAG
jgi:Ankyrin repeats (many copies)